MKTNPSKAPSIRELIRFGHIITHFQPIVSSRRQAVIGLEALARYQFEDDTAADWLFRDAAREALTGTFERHCCETAINNFARLGRRRELALFLNLGSWLTDDPQRGVADLHEFVDGAGLTPSSIAVEILEAKIEEVEQLRQLLEQLRARGFLLVLDDVGKGHSNLDRIALIKPDVIKIDRTLLANVHTDFHKWETLKSLVGLSRRIGAAVVAEGIEAEDEAVVALELGIDMMQGYLFGRPHSEAMSSQAITDATQAIALLGHRFKDLMVERISRRKMRHRQLGAVIHKVVDRLAADAQERFDDVLGETIQVYPEIECLYVLDRDGVQVTTTVYNPNVIHRERSAVFHSGARGADHSLLEYYYLLLDVELKTYTTDPHISFVSGNLCRTVSAQFHHGPSNEVYVLCMDVAAPDATYRQR